jgi:hypothetical protein
MKKLSLLLVIFGCFISNNANSAPDKAFFDALGVVESLNNSKAYNKAENAVGIFQIRKLYFIDAQKFDKSLAKYTHFDCYDAKISERVVSAYLGRYCKNGTPEDFARCHNSGPNWKNKKHLTEKYWQKIKSKLGKDFKI